MKPRKPRFALFFGNRGFFPASLMETARKELPDALRKLGYESVLLDAAATRHGAVETAEEGRIFRNFLDAHKQNIDGVILSLPNFGDENGAVAALKDAGVPIFIQAYPDELDKMAPDKRRDSFCGKFSIMDVFSQYGIPFTIMKPHTVYPGTGVFAENIGSFAKTCSVVHAMKDLTIGAVGARTSPFKTVRIDELALQKYGMTVETFDMATIIALVKSLKEDNSLYKDKLEKLSEYADLSEVPEKALKNLARLSAVLANLAEENGLEAIALRCWMELQQELGISPCVVLGELNNTGLVGACETDIGSAITMFALSAASGTPSACLDWNNNYGDDENKCVLFHCGPIPKSMMTDRGKVVDHEMLKTSLGPGCSYGPHVGRIKPFDFTYGDLLTRDGEIEVYLGEAKFTADPIPEDFFGCAGVAEFDDFQETLLTLGYLGHRHHVALTASLCADATEEALGAYLGFQVTRV